jgi:uncharacterized protein with HEPN domain
MRRDELYLEDIIEACDHVAGFIKDVSFDTFAKSELIRSAVLEKLIVIGEAVSRLSMEFRDRHPEVEWLAIAGLPNRIVHGYFQIDWTIIWTAATEETPSLRDQIAHILAEEFG